MSFCSLPRVALYDGMTQSPCVRLVVASTF